MTRENIRFYQYRDGLYNIVDIYLYDIYSGYEDSYNYYDIDVNKIYKKSDNEYVIRYNDVNKMKVVPLQLKLKIKNFYDIPHELKPNNIMISIDSDDKELFRNIRKIWNKIIKLTGINNAHNFVRNARYGGKYITSNVHENAIFVEGNRYELVMVLDSVVDKCLKTTLV